MGFLEEWFIGWTLVRPGILVFPAALLNYLFTRHADGPGHNPRFLQNETDASPRGICRFWPRCCHNNRSFRKFVHPDAHIEKAVMITAPSIVTVIPARYDTVSATYLSAVSNRPCP